MITPISTLTPRNSTYPFIDPIRHTDRLAGKIVLITGAGRGIGRATAHAFAAAGANVICTARRQSDIDAVAQEINSSSGNANKAIGIAANVADSGAADFVISEAKRHWGTKTEIDILVANAGMTRFNPFDAEPDPKLEDWWRVLEVNLRGTVSFIRAVLPGMKARGSGTVISLASTSGSQDVPYNTAYAASKAAIIKFNQDLGVELQGSGVSCFALHPGSVSGTDLSATEGAVNMQAARREERMMGVFREFEGVEKQTVDLPANTCVALCVEEDAKRMSGRFVDSQHDLGECLEEAKKGKEGMIENERLYWLKLEEL
ncbi:MAG: hypothetical protein Q9222_002343 [Ikaeria aurantiellina]